MTFDRGVVKVDTEDPPIPVPQVRGALVPDASDADGGPLICTLTPPSEDGIPVAVLRLPDGSTWRAVFENQARTFVVPAFAGQGPAHVTAALAKNECSGFDPFFLLVSGVPIPRCRASKSTWTDTEVPWRGGYVSGPLSCRPMSRSAADAAVAESLRLVAGAARSICVTEGQGLGPDTMHTHDGQGHLIDAAAHVGWADPRVRAYVDWFSEVAHLDTRRADPPGGSRRGRGR